MSESAEYYESNWQPQVDFAAEQRRYQEEATRLAKEMRAKSEGEHVKEAERLLPKSIRTESLSPLVMIWDGTGSVGETPGVIAGKMIYFCHEVTTAYLGKETEISFGSFGDLLGRDNERSEEKFPVQARPFAKGAALRTRLGEIVIEAGGGGQKYESIELILLYYARNVHMPNVPPGEKATLILMTDERARPSVSREHAAFVHVRLEESMISTSDIFHELNERFSVYLILQPYNADGADEYPNKMIREDWENYLPKERIAHLYDRQRVMDVSLGILAKETGRVEEFWKELKERQKPEQVASVEKGLRDVLSKDTVKKPRRKRKAEKTHGDVGESKLHEPLTGDDVADLID